ncbi:MAG: ABC transporter substrate-binding protein, partial [Mycobacterium leprae]
MRSAKRFLAILLSLAVLLAVGCSKGQPSGGDNGPPADPNTPVDGGTLYLSMYSAPKGVFNPILYEDQYDSYIIGLVFNGLMRFNEKLEFICDLCETYSISPDNKTVNFTLKKGLKWHDGQPLTTKDVAFTFQAMLHPDYTGVRTGDFAALAGVQKMLDDRDAMAQDVKDKKLTDEEATKKRNAAWEAWLAGPGKQAINVKDDLNISFTTDDPYAPLLNSLSYSIIPEHIYKTTSIAKMEENPAVKKPIGSGPFKFVDFKGDQYVELARNENYHLGKPHIEKIIYKIVNQDVAIGQIKTGEIDYLISNPSNIDMLQGDKNIKIIENADFGYQYMGFNFDRKPLDDKRVRQAIMFGIDRKSMVDQILKGHGTIMNSHMPPSLWAYDASQLNPYDYNPTKASELLAQAGYT